jgi:phosphatidylglycerophosphate synthase
VPTSKTLERSIVLHGVIFCAGQITLLTTIFVSYRMAWPRFFLFLAVMLIYHGSLTAFLLSRKVDFHVEGGETPLTRVNLSNSLTFARLSSIPTLLFLIIQASSFFLVPILLPFACLVFATDFADGIVARMRHQVTFVGRYLDSTSDYLMIIAVSIIFLYYSLIPAWFFVLIIARLVLFAFGMAMLALREGKADPVATFLGKASIFATMVLYVLELAQHFRVSVIGDRLVVTIMEWVVATIIVVSVADKGIFLRRRFAQVPPRPKDSGRAQIGAAGGGIKGGKAKRAL